MDTAQLQAQAAEAARRAQSAATNAASQMANQINSWSTMDTPPSPFEKFVPEKLKGQWNVFPFIYPRIGEPINSNFLKAMGAEFLGTCLFLFILVSQIVFSCLLRDNVNELGKATCLLNPVRVMPIAVTAGFAIFALVYCTASYSGGHLNPAVTLGALAAGKITVMRAVAYIIAQIGGACTGTAFVWTVRSVGGAANQVNADGGYAAAFMAEFLLTFILMFVILCATDASRYRSIAHLPVLAPFAIGVTVLIAHLAAIPLDGCSINPARSLATMMLSGVAFWQQWVFVSVWFFCWALWREKERTHKTTLTPHFSPSPTTTLSGSAPSWAPWPPPTSTSWASAPTTTLLSRWSRAVARPAAQARERRAPSRRSTPPTERGKPSSLHLQPPWRVWWPSRELRCVAAVV